MIVIIRGPELRGVMKICKITKTFALQILFLFALGVNVNANDSPPIFETNSTQGYTVKIFSSLNPILLNQIHEWQLSIERNNAPVSGASIVLTGGMPNHDHGLPTQPKITSEPAPGRYILEGIRFHMPGLWEIIIDISGDVPQDTATIEFKL